MSDARRLPEDHTPWPDDLAARYRRAGYWRGQSLGAMLRERARRHGQRTAVIGAGEQLTYSELDRRADALVAGFHRLGLRTGDRVVVQLSNTPHFPAVCFALFRLGARPVLALPAHRLAEIGYFCELTQARAYVAPDRHDGFDYRELADALTTRLPGLEHVVICGEPGPYTGIDTLYADDPAPLDTDVDAAAVALFQLSGGSTGLPKLIPRTHDDYLYSVRASAEICGLGADSVYLCALPAAHNFPLSSPGVLGTLYAGGTVVFAPQPGPDTTFPLIESHGVTLTALVPPLARLWLDAARHARRDLSSLQVLQVGGAPLSPHDARRVGPALGCKLQQVFGMAEGLVCYTRLDDPDEVVEHTQGRPVSPDDELRVVDETDRPVPAGTAGALLTRGPYTVQGYFRAPEHNTRAFTADGFYRTGDRVRLTPGGNVVVVGRDKDQINRGGEKVAAAEVESHIGTHPDVVDAAVVAVPDCFLGERSCAFVVTRRPGARAGDLVAFLKDRGLARFKIPDRFQFLDALPRTAVGKVDKSALRGRLTPPAGTRTEDTANASGEVSP
jgi:2,3-dihydroxybenzoate-AMP ligase